MGADAPPETTTHTLPLTPIAELGDPSTTVAPVPDPRPATVAVVGDSLSVQAEQAIRAAFAPLGTEIVVFDALEGRRTAKVVDGKPSGVDAVDEIVAGDEPELWIVALGTNDVGGQEDAAAFRTAVEELLDLIPDDAPVIWVDTWVEFRIDGAQALNAVLRQVANTRRDMTVIDWFQFGDDPGIIVDDGVHLTEAGQAKFAEQLAKEYLARFG